MLWWYLTWLRKLLPTFSMSDLFALHMEHLFEKYQSRLAVTTPSIASLSHLGERVYDNAVQDVQRENVHKYEE